ncbi:hypothetical protein GQ55_8G038900 [Panicum hallii var. hallii]|jgi:hypothetical protein|uniref:Uncharacterized protein n=2 Tax=Panicum hallii TaxID=206008 RepID=A0A2T7CKQ7_9POAL|nr:uncharacterized protein LOC112903468 [Panicum hallii]PAN41397.1 hypothetical protein PAHAL_8G040600 [Panicum hallii]PUZ43833.1 hypothetical protein GQ55_8G038900 [Panicum hallii var. hallii]
MRLLPWPWRRPNHPDPAAPPRLDDDVPVAVGTHLHVAAGGDDDDAESTASSERSHRTLPVHADEADPAGDGGLQAVDPRHHEVAGRGSGSEEDGWSWSESDGGEPAEEAAAGHRRRRRAPGRHRRGGGRRRPASAGVPALMVVGPAAAVMLLALVALVAWKRRQRRLL